MPAVALLGQLNEIDLAIDALRARASEIAEALKEPAALQAARTAAAAADAELARCRAVQAERESSQQKTAAKLTQAEGRLYGGKVRNPKELEDAEKDVAQLRRQHAQAEDALLEALIASEAAAETAAVAQRDLARHSAERDAMQVSLRAEHARLTERLAAERARQAAVRRAMPADILHTYDTLRPRRGGPGRGAPGRQHMRRLPGGGVTFEIGGGSGWGGVGILRELRADIVGGINPLLPS